MESDFISIMSAPEDNRRDLFLTTANRLGTTLENVEKDFWVCWVLGLLFSDREAQEPRLLFKGGTSLSKAYGLISRFSEDIDITVFREDLGKNLNASDLDSLSRKKQRRHLDEIRQACQKYIQVQLKDKLNIKIKKAFNDASINIDSPVVIDPDDHDKQTLLVYYPSVIQNREHYIRPSIKIEAGAKSALDPHQSVMIKPYVAQDMPAASLFVKDVITINAERTFWDKVIILHGLRSWFDNKSELQHQGNRISRHYYDIFKLIHSDTGERAKSDFSLALDCARHAKIFFNRAPLNLMQAQPGTFKLMPTSEMIYLLKRDYKAMSSMIFGDIPDFEMIMDDVKALEEQLNSNK